MSYPTGNASRGMEAIKKAIDNFNAEKMGEQTAWTLIGEIYNAVNRADEAQGKTTAMRDEVTCLELELAEKRETLDKIDVQRLEALEKMHYWLSSDRA